MEEVKTTYVRNNSMLYADGNNVEERDKSMMLGEGRIAGGIDLS